MLREGAARSIRNAVQIKKHRHEGAARSILHAYGEHTRASGAGWLFSM